MAEFLDNLQLLEKEVAKYRSKFQESSEVLNDLAKVQINFNNLAQKYQELEEEYHQLTEHIDEAKKKSASLQSDSKSAIEGVLQAQRSFEQRFLELENATNISRTQARESLVQHFANFESAADDRWGKFCDGFSVRLNELEPQIQELKKEFAERLKILGANDSAINARLGSVESEMKSINQIQVSTAEQCKGLEERLSKTEQSVSNLELHTRKTRRLAYMAAIGSLLVIFLGGWLFLFQSRNAQLDRKIEQPRILKPGQLTK
jgi:chromosome segregation ATPase